MKIIYSIIVMSLFSLQLLFAQAEQAILGEWTNEDSTQLVRVEKSGDFYVGKLVNLRSETLDDLLDRENNDEEKKNRKLLGIEVWFNFAYDETRNMWKSGEIYNFKNGNTYNGKIIVQEDELKLTGHYGFFFFLAKTQNWTRVLN